jgi:uncharacterized protein with GYD domain
MATYIVLMNFTEKGIKAVRDTAKRADAAKAMAKKAGVAMKDAHWTPIGRSAPTTASSSTRRPTTRR